MSENEESKLKAVLIDDKLMSEHKDAWAELRKHIVVYTPIMGETIMPITHIPDMPSLVVSSFTR